MKDYLKEAHCSDDRSECDYLDEETGEKLGCGRLLSVGDRCFDCERDNFIKRVGPEEAKRISLTKSPLSSTYIEQCCICRGATNGIGKQRFGSAYCADHFQIYVGRFETLEAVLETT